MAIQAFQIRTDLALEARDLAARRPGDGIPGVHSEEIKENGITIVRMDVVSREGAERIGKQIGSYVTLSAPGLRDKNTELQRRVAKAMAKEFERLLEKLRISPQAKALVVGLGNWNITPDALGPFVVENVMVTRHYFEIDAESVDPGYREVSAIAPGVLGITGIETGDIVQAVVQKTKPDFVIAVDALASRAVERLNTTIQIADTGIHPGSGIGNKRKGLTRETLGVPVVAVGVPTVVYASTIVSGILDLVIRHFRQKTDKTAAVFGALDQLSEEERHLMIKEVLTPMNQDLLVTPKDVDRFIEDIAHIVASGLNAALHQAIGADNAAAYTH